tara:strand:+ start:23877 stop:25757 length:1881 start_codon:yes stop_codon:yes gene_type:complete
MELRETYQTPKHCRLAINCDFSNGLIEPRKGTHRVKPSVATLAISNPQIFAVDDPNGKANLIIIGYSSASSTIVAYVYDTDSKEYVVSAFNLTSLGEPAYPEWRCNVLRTTIGNAHFVAMITSKHGSYIWDPYTDKTTIRTSLISDAVKMSSPEFRYHSKPPVGDISAFMNSGGTYYAGYLPNQSFGVDKDFESDQEDVAEVNVNATRDGIIVGPNAVIGSDPYDPMGVLAQVIFTVPTQEKITGLRSIGENLGIFTDKHIWVMTGDPLIESTRLVMAAEGVGCVAPHAMESVKGAVFFLGSDGIYAFAGGEAKKISDPLNDIFSGDMRVTRLPSAIQSTMTNLGWPFAIDRGKLHLATSCHVEDSHQIWFNVPMVNESAHMSLTIAYDYRHNAFSLYLSSTGKSFSFASDAVQVSGGTNRVFIAASNGTSTVLSEYKGKSGDLFNPVGAAGVGPTYPRGVPYIWWGPRVFRDAQRTQCFRRLRFTQLSDGVRARPESVQWFVEGEASAFDSQLEGQPNSDSTAASGNMDMHPNPESSYFFDDPDFELKGGERGGTSLSSNQYFDNRIDLPAISGKWVSFGFIDYDSSPGSGTVDPDAGGTMSDRAHQPSVTISGYAVDVMPRSGR